MTRVIKAPNIQDQKTYNVVEREKVIRHAEEIAAEIVQNAQIQEEEILHAATEQADQIVTGTQQEAEEILAQAQQQAEETREEGRQEGFQKGVQQGLEQARQQARDLLNTLQTMIAEGRSILEEMFRDQEPEIRNLVCEMVSRIVYQQVEEDNELVVRVTRESLNYAADRQSLRILVHPDDKAKIEEWVPEMMRLFDDIEKISIEVDPRVTRGGVIIESGTGGVDGRIDKQMDILNQTLLNP